ncbi:MAG: TolB family protein [Solirubrobacteraceae bacterium]
MGSRVGPGVGRALIALAVLLGSLQAVGLARGAVAPGKNGVLLLAAPEGTTFAGAHAVARARGADCYSGLPNELWTVHPSGRGLAAVGKGDFGNFSPDGRLLVTSASPGCYSGNMLSLSRRPFRGERAIPGADFTGAEAFATLGPWLGPEDPAFLAPDGSFRDGITGRHLSAGALPAGSMSCSGRVAHPDGEIDTPVRAAGHATVNWRRTSQLVWLGEENETTVQWSPDGRYVYFTTWTRRTSRLWRVDASGGRRRLLFSVPRSADLLSDLSPDGHWILMTTNDDHGGQRLLVITTDGRRLHAVTPSPGPATINASAEWSPRGDLLLVDGATTYPTPTGIASRSFVYVVRPSGGPHRRLPLPSSAVWSPDERYLAYTTGGPAPDPQTTLTPFSLVIFSLAADSARAVLTARVPIDSTASQPGGLAVADWQTRPGSSHPIRCSDGRPPF